MQKKSLNYLYIYDFHLRLIDKKGFFLLFGLKLSNKDVEYATSRFSFLF